MSPAVNLWWAKGPPKRGLKVIRTLEKKDPLFWISIRFKLLYIPTLLPSGRIVPFLHFSIFALTSAKLCLPSPSYPQPTRASRAWGTLFYRPCVDLQPCWPVSQARPPLNRSFAQNGLWRQCHESFPLVPVYLTLGQIRAFSCSYLAQRWRKVIIPLVH